MTDETNKHDPATPDAPAPDTEIERRWLLTREQARELMGETGLAGVVQDVPSEFSDIHDIVQGYYPSKDPLRVRHRVKLRAGGQSVEPTELVTQGTSNEPARDVLGRGLWTLCVKRGEGVKRREFERDADPETAMFALQHTDLRVEKRRHIRDGWELDVFRGPLEGVVVLEREANSLAEAEAIVFPDWIPSPEDAIEITGAVDNYALARTGLSALSAANNTGSLPSMFWAIPRPERGRPLPKIVLTGGSCAGKSTVVRRLRNEGRVQVVPELATFMLAQVGLRPDSGAKFQRALYRTQLVIEEAAEEEALRLGKSAIVLDRGTMDGAAYLEEGLPGLIQAVGTSMSAERLRYDRILQLPVPPEDIYEEHKKNNPARYHGWAEALEHERRLRQTWSMLKGPDHVFMRNRESRWTVFEDEIVQHIYALAEVLATRTHD